MDAQLSPLRRAVADLAALRAGTFRNGEILGASASYWKSWIDLTDGAPAEAASTAQPLLVMSGDHDRNVPPSELAAWRQLFDQGDGPRTIRRRYFRA